MIRFNDFVHANAQKNSVSAISNIKNVCRNILTFSMASMVLLSSMPAVTAFAEEVDVCGPDREVLEGEYLSEDGGAILSIDEAGDEFTVCEFVQEAIARTMLDNTVEPESLPVLKSAVQLEEQCPGDTSSGDYKECYGKKLTNNSGNGKTYSIGDGFYLKDESGNSGNEHEWVIYQGDIKKEDGVEVGRAYVKNGNGGVKGGDQVDNGLVKNGDNIFFIELNPGISVVVRLQENGSYEYWRLTAGDEPATFTLRAQSQDYWMGGVMGQKEDKPVIFCQNLSIGDIDYSNRQFDFAITYGVNPVGQAGNVNGNSVKYRATVDSDSDFSFNKTGVGTGTYDYKLEDEFVVERYKNGLPKTYAYTIRAYVEGETEAGAECVKTVRVPVGGLGDASFFCENLVVVDAIKGANGNTYKFRVTSSANELESTDGLAVKFAIDFGDGHVAESTAAGVVVNDDGEYEYVFEHTYLVPAKYVVNAEAIFEYDDRAVEVVDKGCNATIIDFPNTGYFQIPELVGATVGDGVSSGVSMLPLGVVAAGAALVRRSYKKAAKRVA